MTSSYRRLKPKIGSVTSGGFSKKYTISSQSTNGLMTTSGKQYLKATPEYKKQPMIEMPLYPVSLDLEIPQHLTHHIVWKNLFPEIPFAKLRRHDDEYQSSTQMYFFNASDRETFQIWLDNYLTKFTHATNLPSPSDGVYPHVVQIAEQQYEAEVLLEWIWILQNCTDEVRYASPFWFFRNEDDATLYRMRY